MQEFNDIYFPKQGDLVEGVVVQVSDKEILLDINAATEGTMYLDHYTLDKNAASFKSLVKVGDKIECRVTKVSENSESLLIMLSALENAKKEAFNANGVANLNKAITVTIKKKVNAGYITEYKGVSFFLHESQTTEHNVGDKIKVVVTNVDEQRGDGKVSERQYLKMVENEKKAKAFEKLTVGDTISGDVSRIEAYGLFIKFNDVLQGLVRNKEISHIFEKNPASNYKLGQKVDAKVINLENGQIELSIKAMSKSPFELFAESHKVSDKITVKAIQKLPFGVLCEVAENVTALLHESEITWNPNDNSLAYIHEGDTLEVAIILIDSSKNKISLSKKALEDNPWSRVKAQAGDEIECKVTEVSPKGLKIEALGVDGFVDVRDINLEKSSSKLDDYYTVDDMVKGIIVKCDPKTWELKVSIKKYQDKLQRAEFDKFLDEQESNDSQGATLGDLFDLKK